MQATSRNKTCHVLRPRKHLPKFWRSRRRNFAQQLRATLRTGFRKAEMLIKWTSAKFSDPSDNHRSLSLSPSNINMKILPHYSAPWLAFSNSSPLSYKRKFASRKFGTRGRQRSLTFVALTLHSSLTSQRSDSLAASEEQTQRDFDVVCVSVSL